MSQTHMRVIYLIAVEKVSLASNREHNSARPGQLSRWPADFTHPAKSGLPDHAVTACATAWECDSDTAMLLPILKCTLAFHTLNASVMVRVSQPQLQRRTGSHCEELYAPLKSFKTTAKVISHSM